MQTPGYDPVLPRNPITNQRHRREVFWQVTFPFIIVSLILLVMAALAAGLSAASASKWADISLIWMIIPAMLISILMTILLAGGVYLILWLLRILPFYFFKGHNWFLQVNLQVGRVGDRLAEPFLRVRAWKAGADALGQQVQRKKRSPRQ